MKYFIFLFTTAFVVQMATAQTDESKSLTTYGKYDFVQGDTIIFERSEERRVGKEC